jgi:predicted RNA-binding Zn-ribbon protein involved in translation (DUF1610 family)
MNVGPYICESCGHAGERKRKVRGSFAIELVLWCCFLLPGLIYTLWRQGNKHYVCPSCSGNMILCDSPRGMQLVKQLHPEATGIITAGWFS